MKLIKRNGEVGRQAERRSNELCYALLWAVPASIVIWGILMLVFISFE